MLGDLRRAAERVRARRLPRATSCGARPLAVLGRRPAVEQREQQRRRRRSRSPAARRRRTRSAPRNGDGPRAARPAAAAAAARARPARTRSGGLRVGRGPPGGGGRRDQIAGHVASSVTSISRLAQPRGVQQLGDVVAVQLAGGDQPLGDALGALAVRRARCSRRPRTPARAGRRPAAACPRSPSVGGVRVVVDHPAAGAVHELEAELLEALHGLLLGLLALLRRPRSGRRGRSGAGAMPWTPTMCAAWRGRPSRGRRRRRSCSGRRRRARPPSRRGPRSGRRPARSASGRSGPRSPSPGGGRRRSRACGSRAASRAGSPCRGAPQTAWPASWMAVARSSCLG